MRPRIHKTSKIVASTANDSTIQELCSFNRRTHKQQPKTNKVFILTCFGLKKIISESEYNNYASQGLTDLIRVEYV
jgi:hypothetical protein